MGKFCKDCGRQIIGESVFCSGCGSRIPAAGTSAGSGQPLTLSQEVKNFETLINAAFYDPDLLDELTVMKYIIKFVENDLDAGAGYSRDCRTNRLLLLQGVLEQMDFDIRDSTIEYLYDSLIADLDRKKIPGHSMLHVELNARVSTDASGTVCYELVCPACDRYIRYDTAEDHGKSGRPWKLICPHCSFNAVMSRPPLVKKE